MLDDSFAKVNRMLIKTSPFFSPFLGLPLRIWLLAAVNFVNRCGAMVMCFLTLYLTESLHYPLTYAGYAMSCYGIGAVVGVFLGGRLADRWGYQRVQLVSLLATGVALVVVLQIHNFWAMCVALFLLNVVSEAFRPANSTAIRQNSTLQTFTRSASLMRMAFNLAITFALTIGGLLIALGWQYIFWVDAFTCWVAAFVLWWFVPEVHRSTSSKPSVAMPNNSAMTDAPSIQQVAVAYIVPSVSPYRNRQFLSFVFSTFLGAFAFMQIVWTVPPFFKNVYHWNEATIGIVCAINGLAVMLIEMPLIYRIEHKQPAMRFIRWGIVLYAIAYLSLTLPVSLKWLAAVFYMLVISLGEIFVMPFSSTWVAQNTSTERQGDYWALYGIAYSVANILAPLIGTQIIDNFGYTTLWCFVAIVCAAAWLGLLIQSKITSVNNIQTATVQ